MMSFPGIFRCLALAKRLCSETPILRLLTVAEPRAWFTAKRQARFAQLIVAAILFVAAGDLISMPGSVELAILHAADVAPYLTALLAATAVAAVSGWKAARQAHRADLSYWRIRALDVSTTTFGKHARRRRGNAPSAGSDDPAFGHAIAA